MNFAETKTKQIKNKENTLCHCSFTNTKYNKTLKVNKMNK